MQKRDIRGFEGLYYANELGQIVNSRTGRVLKQGINSKGYRTVVLSKNSILYTKRVHRLVFEAFYRRLLPNEEVHHLNLIRTQNEPTNLVAWDSRRHKEFHLSDQEAQVNKGKNISKALKGHKVSVQTKQKISESHKGKPSPLKGRKRGSPSQQTKKKISEALKGRIISQQWKEKISQATKGKKKHRKDNNNERKNERCRTI